MHNYMEDVVIDVLDILLKERDNICKCRQCKLDIVAFALNRLPAKYIVSERGFTHSFIEEINNLDRNADIISILNLGIEIISKRKRHHYEHSNNKDEENAAIDILYEKEDNVYYYNFPHIIGQVVDKDTLTPLENVKVTLCLDEEIVESNERSWNNPYFTNKAALGFYSFWAKSIRIYDDLNMPQSKKFNFKLLFTCENYYSYNKDFYIIVEPEDFHYQHIRRSFTEKIDKITLEKRKR